MFGPKSEELKGCCSKVHNEGLPDKCSSQNVVRVIKSNRMISTGHMARMGDMRNTDKFSVGKPGEITFET